MDTEPVVLRFREGTLTLEGVAPLAVQRLFPTVPWARDVRTGEFRTDAMYYKQVLQDFRGLAAPLRDEVPQWHAISTSACRLPTLRDEQHQAVNCWMNMDRRASIVMPTGTGKTVVALSIIAQLQSSVLIVAPVRDLMYQWHRRILEHFSIDAGIVGDQTYRVSPVSVTTYDSACIHMARLGNLFDLIVFDECHHLPGELRCDAARMCAARHRLGLTATYERADHRHTDLEQLIGPVAYRLSIPEVKGRSLAEYEVVRIPVYLEPVEQKRYDDLASLVAGFMSDRRKTDPTFTWDKVAATRADLAARRAFKAFMEKRSIEDRAQEKLRVLEDLFRLHAGEPVLVFAGSNAMARDVSLRFLVPCLLSHCGKRERLDMLRGLEDGTYPALVANRVLDEGVDLPDVKVAIVIGGMSSSRQAQQRLGRILRKRGGQRAVLYEIVTATHGEIQRSRRRRQSDAYQGTRHYKL